ncbi:sensor histidine kinase [Streptomyces sp. SAJ15]|uniref:sensor histidine kinase n=1 Tax=Streptomyces sp. SAJ15 TaxID=2011095 RepID=UPI0011855365|nr:sensor histidine kinase [Streptomyces sp. SAJ15]TVL90402.1 two-component sensor histidine kinase [Streptomyces sp. SAJ15]
MDRPPQAEDPFPIRRLRRWYTGCWLLFGPTPSVLGTLDDTGPATYASLALVAVITTGFAVLETRPHNPLLPPAAYLWVLALGIGAMSVLPGGGAALLIVSLPIFWIHTDHPHTAIVISGVAAVATTAGSIVKNAAVTGNAVFAVLGYTAGVLGGLLIHRITQQGEEQAHLLGAALEDTQQRLAEAHRSQGAAEERERLAREIHDTLAQGFASIVVLAEAARSALREDPARTAQQLVSIEQTARENLAEARVLVGAAPQTGLTPGSIAQTLRRTLDRFTQDTGLTVEAELPDVTCDQQTRIALLRCLQESLANIRKHADATTVSVFLASEAHTIELEITDDGRGFDVDGSHGFGLNGMRKRMAELDGELTITSSPGEGTRLLAQLPTKGRE